MLFAGYVNGDGRCNGAASSDPCGTWRSVIVQGTVKITLPDQEGRIKLNSNAIILHSGTASSLSEGSYIGSEGGYTFWDSIPIDNCKFIKTAHPKLLIFETTYGESFAIAKTVSVSNLGIFTYVNSKFVYVEKHIRAQIKLLYRDVIFQECNLERQTIKNSRRICFRSYERTRIHGRRCRGSSTYYQVRPCQCKDGTWQNMLR